MKHYIIGIALALALVMGVAAFAEATDPTADSATSVTKEATAAEEATEATTEEAPAEEAPTVEAPAEDEQKGLQDALDAYRAAKQDKAVSDLEEELNGYVAAGSMTQEQADLILNSIKEKIAERNGECPNCGYDLRGQNKGMRGGKMGGQQRGQMNGQLRPDAQSGATPRQSGQQRGQMPGNQQQNGQVPQMNGQIPSQQMPGLVPQM